MEDRRQFQRFCLDCLVSISASTVYFETELLNLSFRGALVVLPPKHREEVQLHSSLCATIVLAPTVTIEMTGNVVHQSSNTVGIQCTWLDPQSASRLSRFVELSMGAIV